MSQYLSLNGMGFLIFAWFSRAEGDRSGYFDESLWCQNVLTKLFTSIDKEGIFVLTLMAINAQSVLGKSPWWFYDVS